MQLFLQAYNLNNKSRKHFKMPYLRSTNYATLCNCHKKKIDIGWICSVCLAIYCQDQKDMYEGVCMFCGCKYDMAGFNQTAIEFDAMTLS